MTARDASVALSPRTRASLRRISLPMAACAASAMLPWAPPVARAADYEVTLSRAFLERLAEDAVTSEILTADPDLHWGQVSGRRVEVSRRSQTQIDVDLDLAYAIDNFPDPEVDVDITLGFSCFYARPDINMALPNLDVSVNFPWYVDVATLGLSWVGTHVANVIIDNKLRGMAEMKAKVIAEINDQLGAASFEFCPAFAVTTQGDVIASFGEGDECSPGQRRHLACPRNQVGSGTDQHCVNGYWEGVRDCEPKAPPGGQRP
jgi:hypothetical protein